MDLNAKIHFLEEVFSRQGLLSGEQVTRLSQELASASTLTDIENALIGQGLLTEEAILTAYGKFLNLPFRKLDKGEIDPQLISLIPPKFANKNKLIAIQRAGSDLTVALRHPFDIDVLDELKIFTGLNIHPVVAPAADIEKAIKLYYGTGAETVEKLVKESRRLGPAAEVPLTEVSADIEAMAQDASMINYVNQLLSEACRMRATDIHIEPFETRLRIRHRIDGVLYEAKTPPEVRRLHDAIISRFKIMANLNVAEKRRPQDGRCEIRLDNQQVDLRLATFPTLFGEGLSIRLLSRDTMLLGLDQLGLGRENTARLQTLLSKPHGILLVTGPTGCGKTTTLYSCIHHLNDSRINIVTLEDPIEYHLEGINQIQTNPKVDLTFANGFRSILRQDPDVILVGEIRDLETAQIATRAALTGHLILSTLHTNSALATVARLLNLGVESYLAASTLKGIIAQRLVRTICPHCKEAYTPQRSLLEALGAAQAASLRGVTFYRGRGCSECNETGTRGRMAIFELLTVDERLSSLIMAGAPVEKLEQEARAAGFRTLKEDGLEKVKQGLIPLEEVIRVSE